ncbi:MAG: Rieske 2Fe-2S domain-containing protein [Abitibacteriaceae bacterium]|nr:Rieske 2Fe-2S domain-containing protein [Abditibacteriaceae bacterium]
MQKLSTEKGDVQNLDPQDFIPVAPLEQLAQKRCIVVKGKDRPIAVFYHDGQVHAVDNRCPHMGFPLHQGSVTDGILTCHWHHARFDLTSGCTFDLFADDVPSHEVEIRDGQVWVCNSPRQADAVGYWKQRLQEGMEQNIGLIIAKAVIALLKAGVPARDIVETGALFGARYRDSWASGMTILTALANLVPYLPEEEKFLALYQGLRRVAGDSAGQVPRRDRHPLDTSNHSHDTLERWFRYWTLVRHRDGAERTILTAIHNEADPAAAEIMFAAATDRAYADTGHTLDFINKAFEVLEIIGWAEAEKILPTVVGQLVAARGGEESNSWRHPIDLVPLMEGAFEQLPAWFESGHGKPWHDEAKLARQIMGDDPAQIIGALRDAICAGAQPGQLSKALCYAAALRIAHFGTANEFGDWITALHTFTYCNALHQAIKRVASSGAGVWGNPQLNGHEVKNGTAESNGISSALTGPLNPEPRTLNPNITRGVFQGAMSVYLDRFLNVPPAPLPGARDQLDDEPTDAAELREKFLDALNSQQRVDAAARVVARYLNLGHPIEPLIATLARGVLREDADFHTYQMLEASVQQYNEWGSTPEGQHILIALARYMAAHSPTQRAQLQTAEIALRLHRGEALYEDEAEG